jgi:hypothetical protein
MHIYDPVFWISNAQIVFKLSKVKKISIFSGAASCQFFLLKVFINTMRPFGFSEMSGKMLNSSFFSLHLPYLALAHAIHEESAVGANSKIVFFF